MKFNSKILIYAIPVILLCWLVYYFSDIAIYVIVAWVLSMIGAPIVRFLRKHMSNNAAAGLTLVFFSVIFGLLISIFVPTLIQQARNLARVDYQSIADGLEEPIKDWNNWLADKGLVEPIPDDTLSSQLKEELIHHSIEQIVSTEVIDVDSIMNIHGDSLVQTNVTLLVNVLPSQDHDHEENIPPPIEESDDFFSRVQKSIIKYLDPSRIPKLFGSVLGFFSNVFIAIMSIFFIAFFFLREDGLFDKMITSFVPDKFVGKTLQAVNKSSQLLIRYFVGILTQITIITLFVSFLLSLLGVKNALLIGFFAALMNVIPYLGPLFGAAFAIIITVSSNLGLPFYTGMLPLLGKVIAVFAIMQLLDNFILQPNIFSRSVKAHPLEIFIVVLMGAKVGGILGMVLAIPAYTVFRVIAQIFLNQFKIIQTLTRSL